MSVIDSDRVKLNIGVPGAIETLSVEKGSTVRDALRLRGIDPKYYEIRGWRSGDASSRALKDDDRIDDDMTILALRAIVGNAPHASNPDPLISDLRNVAAEVLSQEAVRDLWLSDADGFDDADQLQITIVLDPSAVVSGRQALVLIGKLREYLEQQNDMRFPLVGYAKLGEYEASAVEPGRPRGRA